MKPSSGLKIIARIVLDLVLFAIGCMFCAHAHMQMGFIRYYGPRAYWIPLLAGILIVLIAVWELMQQAQRFAMVVTDGESRGPGTSYRRFWLVTAEVLLVVLLAGSMAWVWTMYGPYAGEYASSVGTRAYRHKDYALAAQYFERAIALGDESQVMWAAALIKGGRPAEVPRAVNTPDVRDLHPEDFNILGAAALAEGKPTEAVKWLKEAVRRAPNRPWYHFNLSIALEKSGDKQGAAHERLIALEHGDSRLAKRTDPVLIAWLEFPL
jgi:tetratricopeptide (TPR) repeat protein